MDIEKAKSRIDNQLFKSIYSDVAVNGFHPTRVIQALKSIIGINIEEPSEKLIDWGDAYLGDIKSLPKDHFKYSIKKSKETIVLSNIGDCIVSGNRNDCISELQDLCSVSDGSQIFEYLIEFSLTPTEDCHQFISCLPFVWSAYRSNLFLKNRYSYELLLLSVDIFLKNKLYQGVSGLVRPLFRDVEQDCVLKSIASSAMTRQKNINRYLRLNEPSCSQLGNFASINQPDFLIDINRMGRAAILTYLEDLDFKNITAELLLILDSFRMVLKADTSYEMQSQVHNILNCMLCKKGWIDDKQNW